MLPDGRRIGPHIALRAGMVRAAERAAAIGASAVQIFVDNPTAWRRRPALPVDLAAFRDRLARDDIAPLAVHAAYLVNLAGHDDAVFERSCDVLASDMVTSAAYGARFVNVHIGSHRGAGPEAGAARVALGVRRVLDTVDAQAQAIRSVPAEGPPILILENGAGAGDGLGATIEELADIDAAIEAAGVPRERFGFCLDTAHLWGAGYAIGDGDGVDATLAAFDRAVGLGRLHMIHLNDTRASCGSRTDRHEHIGAGMIGPAGLARFLVHPGLAHVAYYLETPGMEHGYDAVNLDRARALAAGRALDTLPEAAFTLPSSRSRSGPA